MSFEDLLIAKEDFSFVPRKVKGKQISYEVWEGHSHGISVVINFQIKALFKAQKFLSTPFDIPLTPKQVKEIFSITSSEKFETIIEAKNSIKVKLQNILLEEQFSQLDFGFKRATPRIFYIVSQDHSLENSDFYVIGSSGFWELPIHMVNSIQQITPIPSFSTRPQLLDFLHKFVSQHLYVIYNTTPKSSWDKYWQQLVKPEFDLNKIFE